MTNYRQTMADALKLMYLMREYKLMERELTPAEEKKREEVAKDLDDGDSKKRYGDRWKEVKMAVATKITKGEKMEEDQAAEKKYGRKKAGSYGRPGSKKQKRAASKAVRKLGKKIDEDLDEGDPDFSPVKGRKVKTVNMTHKTSGKEVVVVDNPKKIKEMEKLGFVKEEVDLDNKIDKLPELDEADVNVSSVSFRSLMDVIQELLDKMPRSKKKQYQDEVSKIMKDLGVKEEAEIVEATGMEIKKWFAGKGVKVKVRKIGSKYISVSPVDGDMPNEWRKRVLDKVDFFKDAKTDMNNIEYGNVRARYIAISPNHWDEFMKEDIDEARKKPGLDFECQECGKVFTKQITPKTVEIKCPKCKSIDVDVAEEVDLVKAVTNIIRERGPSPMGARHLPSKGEGKFQVKTAKSKMGKMTVKEFDNLDDAKKHLANMEKKGQKGIISQDGKPVKEEVDLDEAPKNYYEIGGDRYDAGVVFNVYVKGKKVHDQILDADDDYEYKGKKYGNVDKAMDAIAKAHGLKAKDFKRVNMEEVELDEVIPKSVAYGLIDAETNEILEKGSKKLMMRSLKKRKKEGQKTTLVLTQKKVGDKVLGIGEDLDEKIMKHGMKVKVGSVLNLQKGYGFYDTTNYPIGGKFDRVKDIQGMELTVTRLFPTFKGMDAEGETKDGRMVAVALPVSGGGGTTVVKEGAMSQLHHYIKIGWSAEKIAKTMKVDVKTIKKLMSESARSDAMKAIAKDPEMKQRPFTKDDGDEKGESKNIIMQMRKVVSLRGKFKVEFLDGKKKKIDPKIAHAVQNKYNSFRTSQDKEKFQAKVAKSYKDMLSALKEGNEMQEGFEKVVLNLLKRDKIGGYFSNSKLYVDMRDVEDTKASMKDAMKRRDISQMPSIVGEANESKLDLVDTVRNTMSEAKEKGPRQLVDPNKEVMIVKKNKVIVIDKKDLQHYTKIGWNLAEAQAYDYDRFLIKGNKAILDNPKHGEKDGPNHVWAEDEKDALKRFKKEDLDEGFPDYKSIAKEIKKDLGRKVSERDISDWIQDNVDDPHKTDPDEVADELKKVGVRVESLEEGTWALPKTGKQKAELKKLMSKPLPVGDMDKEGPDDITNKLYNLVGDDELFDDLYSLYKKKGKKADALPLLKKALKRLTGYDTVQDQVQHRESILDTIGKKIQERKNG